MVRMQVARPLRPEGYLQGTSQGKFTGGSDHDLQGIVFQNIFPQHFNQLYNSNVHNYESIFQVATALLVSGLTLTL